MDAPDGAAAVNRIQVVVRVRPVLPHEVSEPVAVTCSPDGTRVQVALPEKETSKPAIAASTRPDAKAYSFDACLTGSTTQAQLSDICGMDELVEAAVDGYNVTVFAFGQTGSGKTYSVIGPSLAGFQEAAWSAGDSSSQTQTPGTPGTPAAEHADSPAADSASGQQLQHSGSDRSSGGNSTTPAAQDDDGLLPRCMTHLYSYIEERKQEVTCRVMTSCVEIYNEAVTDLFARNKAQQLQVRYNDSSEGFYVDGLTQKEVASNNKALQLMSDALMYRHTRAHRLNLQSSRSHCLITFTVASQELATQGRAGVRRIGKLVLVDLAGSERLKDTGNTAKDAVRETGSINKSLFTLGQVLAALSVRSGCGITGHVPYRDSKLTQLLWDGLKGGGRALMLACLSPLKVHADESLNTLHFASMALRIKSQPIIMMDPQDQMVLEMRDMIKALQTDCRSLAAAVTQMSTGADMSSVMQSLPPTLVQDALRYGSASAPSSQQPRQPSPARADRQLRASGVRRSGNKSIGGLIKPSTADPALALRHSLPALYGSNSPSKDSPSRRKQQQLQQPWNSSPKSDSIGGLYPYQQPPGQLAAPGLISSISSNTRSSWPAYATPPRSGNSSPQHSSVSPVVSLMARAAGPPSFSGSPMAYAPGSPAKQPVWTGVSKYPGLAAREATAAAPADSGLGYNPAAAGYYGTSYTMGGVGYNPAAAAGLPAGQVRSVMDFPELAALEQQFMQQQFDTSQQQQGGPDNFAGLIAQPGGPMQEYAAIGTNSVLIASGLPASIQAPTTLVPVRLGATDTETVGTSPDASPVVVAIAAAENQVRPIAVPLPPAARRVSRVGPSEGSSAGTSSSGGQQQQDPAAAAAQAEQQPAPEPKALGWAERNMWFGTDTDMTQLAYQVHDDLVAQGIDPASDVYYAAIEHKVAEQLPEKWMQWQAIMAAAASSTALGRSKQQQQQQSPSSNYTSYRISLKSAVPRLSGAAVGAGQQKPTNALEASNLRQQHNPQQQQQQQQQVQQQALWRPTGNAASHQQQQVTPAAAAAGQQWNQGSPQQHDQQVHASPTLSVLLQAPKVSFSGSFNPKQQQQLAPGAANLPGRAFAEQMLALYQQHNNAGQPALLQQGQVGVMSQVGMQQQHPSFMEPASPIGSLQGLPELRQSASPIPTSPAGVGEGMASLVQPGLPGQLMYSTNSAAVNPLQGLYQQQQQQQLQQQQASRLGGVTAAAGQVLANSQASYYNGAGPLTVGSRQSWNASKSFKNIQSGRDLAEVLRSGMSPGNKSMADLQADYREARALVLDQLRRQKEETEQQKKRILLQIGKAINSSRWQS